MSHTLPATVAFPTLSPVYGTSPLPPLLTRIPSQARLSPPIHVVYPPSPPAADASESSTASGSSASTIRSHPTAPPSLSARPKRIRGQRTPSAENSPQEEDEGPHEARQPEPAAPALAPAAPIRPPFAHQPISAGKPGALRLNLEAIKRTVSESHVATAAAPYASPILRRKTGELIKPSLKPHSRSSSDVGHISASSSMTSIKSAPATPIGPKFVHFDAQLEHVKLFLAEQKPLAVSRDGSPTADTSDADEFPFPGARVRLNAPSSSETEMEQQRVRQTLSLKYVGMPNLPRTESLDQDLYLEDLQLAGDSRSLNGFIIVRNIAFAKWVAVRFTFDWWQTTSEVTGRHVESIRDGAFDRFAFTIKLVDMLPRITEKTLFMALRYNVAGREIWDSNGGGNYQVHFETKRRVVDVVPVQPKAATVVAPAAVPAAAAATAAGKTSPTDEITVLRRSLEKVVSAERHSTVRAWIGTQADLSNGGPGTFSPPSGTHRYTQSFPSLSGPAAGGPQRKLSPDPASLKQRYDFGASLRSTWSPPQLRSPTNGRKTLPATTAAGPVAPGGGIPFPSSGERVPQQPPVENRTFSLRAGGALSPGRGSPRDAEDHMPRFTLDPERDYRASPHGTPTVTSATNSGPTDAKVPRGRNHQRSYFDSWAAQHVPSTVKKTPTTSPAGSQINLPPLSSSSETESETETETDATGSDVEEEDDANVTPRIGDIVPPSPSPPEGKAGGNVRFNSYPMDNASRSPSSIINNAQTTLSPPWAVPIGLSPSDSSMASTPSATSASSPSMSPSSPSEYLPLASPLYGSDADVVGNGSKVGSMMALHGGDRVPVDSTHYNFFLDRFCFFTGPSAFPSSTNHGGIAQRRTHSASSVDRFMSPRPAQSRSPSYTPRSTTSPIDSPSSLTNINHYGFSASSSGSFGGWKSGIASGGTTPTASPPLSGNLSPNNMATPRPGTPGALAVSTGVPVTG